MATDRFLVWGTLRRGIGDATKRSPQPPGGGIRRLLCALWVVAIVLGCAPHALAQSIVCNDPKTFVYKGALETQANYIIVTYGVSNDTKHMVYNSWRVILQSPDGKQFDDGYHPMVKTSYCNQWPSGCPGMKDALTARGELLPGSNIWAMAIFRVEGPFPDRLTMALATINGLEDRRIYKRDGDAYVQVKDKPEASRRKKH